ncbi:hypothetical protein [Nostoc sp.]|uniref:hypothetical protein n=1 Tax=Nostoc sp. TaxID=1180 RepID=UPI002FF7268B
MAEKLTVVEAAELLGKAKGKEKSFHKTYVFKLINQKRLKAERNEKFNYYEIDAQELERFIKEDFLIEKSRSRNARRDKMKAARSDKSL